jgi:hypothetical protein
MLDAGGIHARLREQFGDAIGALEGSWVERMGDGGAVAHRRGRRLRAHRCGPPLRLLVEPDRRRLPERSHIQVVYHLFSYALRHSFVLKVNASRDDPRVATVSSVWSTADWQEARSVRPPRHPLRRTPRPPPHPHAGGLAGPSARKDFVEPQEYHGIPTSRESLLKA